MMFQNRKNFTSIGSGRTGRNDKDGYALTMVCPEDEERFKKIEFDYKLSCEMIDKNSF